MTERASPEQRAAAVAVYGERGLAAAHHETGLPKSSIRRWGIEAGLDPAVVAGQSAEQTAAANVAREARVQALRSELREQLLVEAADMLERMHLPHVVFVGREGRREDLDEPTAEACRNYMTTAAIALDKFRLESGEATSRTDELPMDERIERMLRVRDDLEARRERRAS